MNLINCFYSEKGLPHEATALLMSVYLAGSLAKGTGGSFSADLNRIKQTAYDKYCTAYCKHEEAYVIKYRLKLRTQIPCDD